MSYCRFSTDDYRCDLYVYESARGIEIHVADLRHNIAPEQFPAPIPDLEEIGAEEWVVKTFERCQVVAELLKDAEWSPIGLGLDGLHYVGDHRGAALVLRRLAEAGYRFPADVTDEILEEAS